MRENARIYYSIFKLFRTIRNLRVHFSEKLNFQMASGHCIFSSLVSVCASAYTKFFKYTSWSVSFFFNFSLAIPLIYFRWNKKRTENSDRSQIWLLNGDLLIWTCALCTFYTHFSISWWKTKTFEWPKQWKQQQYHSKNPHAKALMIIFLNEQLQVFLHPLSRFSFIYFHFIWFDMKTLASQWTVLSKRVNLEQWTEINLFFFPGRNDRVDDNLCILFYFGRKFIKSPRFWPRRSSGFRIGM